MKKMTLHGLGPKNEAIVAGPDTFLDQQDVSVVKTIISRLRKALDEIEAEMIAGKSVVAKTTKTAKKPGRSLRGERPHGNQR